MAKKADNTSHAFVHIVTDKNIDGSWTYIDNELTNNNPNALVFVTQRWGKNGINGVYNDHPIGVWYSETKHKWSIYNQRNKNSTHDQSIEQAMASGVAFNVWVYPTPSSKNGNKTSNSDNVSIPISSRGTQTAKFKNLLIKSVFYIILSVFAIWLFIGFILYLYQNVTVAHWQNIFMLQNNPLISIALLLIVVIILLIFIGQNWGKLFAWFGSFDPLKRPMQAAILLSIAFFGTLLAMALLFPDMTGYSFKSDWSLLLMATIPFLALIALILINKYSSLHLEGAGFKFEFSGAMMTMENDQTQIIRVSLEENSIDYISNEVYQGAIAADTRILIVEVDEEMSLELSFLQQHVRKMRQKKASIYYIVFVKNFSHYLGFISVDEFLELQPQMSSQQPQIITEKKLKQLGFGKKPLKKSDFLEAYRQMIQENTLGIPVVDEDLDFLGVIEKDKIEQAAIMELLEKSAKQS
jgi:hypothetical protein